MPPLGTPLSGSKFNLNSAGVAGFFGGEEAIPAMATVCLFRGGRWLGWYNSPGSYTIAKRFSRMANSRFWAGLFPGPRVSPALTFGLDGTQGPLYIAALSGTKMETGHLGYLTMEWCKQWRPVDLPGRKTMPSYVAYLDMTGANFIAPVKCLPLKDALFALIPITTSIMACIMCILVDDWFSFSMIFLGIISSGSAGYVIGGGKLVIKRPNPPASEAPPGHGILIGDRNVVVIKGSEGEVNAITKGHFDLEMNLRFQADEEDADEVGSAARNNRAVGFCCLLLLLQFLFQLLLIPQGSLFGQIMFLISLVVSWTYNTYLASLEKENIQTRILFQTLGNPNMLRFRVGSRTTTAVFVCLLLSHNVEVRLEQKRSLFVMILHSLIPNDTVVWRRWREKVIDQLLDVDDESEPLSFLEEDEEDRELPEPDRMLLRMLLNDADSAIRGYFGVRWELP